MRLVQRRHAVVVEARGHGAEHRHAVGRLREQLAVALVLLAHVAQRVLGALAVELVDGDEVGEIEHVDLLELAGGAEFRRHHVERDVDQRHDGRVALADARGLDHDQIEAGDLAGGDHLGQRRGDFGAGIARRQRAHEDLAATSMAFMRMRSPSSAPPVRLRDGSIEMTAMRGDRPDRGGSGRINSSVSEDLPAPPVPVMPSTGILMPAAACSSAWRAPHRRRCGSPAR